MIATSKLYNNIVFSLAIICGPRAEEVGAEGRSREPRVQEHKHPLISENKNPEFPTPIDNEYINVVKFMKITSNPTQKRKKTQKKRRKTKN